ncbi:hypothetical protein SRHO_G00094520 [Serrasalmus rhombeus]
MKGVKDQGTLSLTSLDLPGLLLKQDSTEISEDDQSICHHLMVEPSVSAQGRTRRGAANSDLTGHVMRTPSVIPSSFFFACFSLNKGGGRSQAMMEYPRHAPAAIAALAERMNSFLEPSLASYAVPG